MERCGEDPSRQAGALEPEARTDGDQGDLVDAADLELLPLDAEAELLGDADVRVGAVEIRCRAANAAQSSIHMSTWQ